MLAEHLEKVKDLIFADENEAAAIALCGRSAVPEPWTGSLDERFLVREIIPVPKTAYSARSPAEFTWSTTPFYQALKRAESKDLAVAVFHSHPHGYGSFSERDDVAEKDLFAIAFDRLDSRRLHLSVVIERGGHITARAYGPDLKPQPVADIVTIGEKWSFDNAQTAVSLPPELDRQIRAFGAASTEQLARLRIGIIGCGGTGSAVASLLARIGVRHVALFDADHVDDTNLNRLHFSARPDASLRRHKIDVVAEGMARIGMPMNIIRVAQFVDHEDSIRVLRACDLVFGCTDDHLGREILNRLAHFYFIPVIDLGLLIEPNTSSGYDTFDGRVTVVQPGYPCQSCRGLIDAEEVYLDSLRRDPSLLAERRRAGYVPNDPAPSPVVVTFTTEVATMAINELFHRLNGFRGAEQHCSEHVRQFQYLKNADLLPSGRSQPGCKLCGSRRYDGRGDMSPLLDLSL
jgi:molybdopterin/thiamine biosynthesis adenylyltransferase